MKLFKLIALIISVLCCAKLSNAQDVIIKKDNSTILSKVVKISASEIEYKKWSNQDGPTYIIKKSEVSSINYENGEKDVFDKQTERLDLTKTMRRVGYNLVLDHVLLSDHEVQELVGEDNYKTYLSAKNQIIAGRAFTAIFALSLGATIGLTAVALINHDSDMLTLAYGTGLVADVSLVSMCVLSGAGKGRMNWVADEFNKQHQDYSVNLSPSLIRCNTPQSQNNYGLGLTLSLNF